MWYSLCIAEIDGLLKLGCKGQNYTWHKLRGFIACESSFVLCCAHLNASWHCTKLRHILQLGRTWLYEAHGDWLSLLGANNFQLEKAGYITLCLACAVLNASKLLSRRGFINSTSI